MSTIQHFSVDNTGLKGVKLITPFFLTDERGYFIKSFEKDVFSSFGLDLVFNETFESRSAKYVLRGLHFQTVEPQSKLVSVSMGCVFDVIVDLRKNSPTYGRWEGFELSEQSMKALFIPAGFAHGFISLAETSIVNYKCCGRYLKEYDTGIIWNDRDLNITWPVTSEQIKISDRDSKLMTFSDFNRIYGGLDHDQRFAR